MKLSEDLRFSQSKAPKSPSVFLVDELGRPAISKEVVARSRNLDALIPPPVPTYETAPVRDLGRESRDQLGLATVAAVVASLLGARRVAGVTASAIRGARVGSDLRFQESLKGVEDRNKNRRALYDAETGRFRLLEQDAERRGRLERESDLLAQKRATDKANYLAGLDGLDEESLQARLDRDEMAGVHQGLGIELPRREDGRWDVSAVTTPRQVTQKSLDASRLADDEKAVLEALRRTAPEGRQGVLNALAPGLAARGSAFVQDEAGNWIVPGVDLASLDAAPTGANSPEALAAKEKKAQADAGRRGALELLDTWGQLIAGDRLKPEARTELWKRSGIVRDALAKGEPIPSWVWEMSPDAVAAMAPAQRERLDNEKTRLGIAKKAQEETKRHNYATEARLLAESKNRTEKAGAASSARFQAAQSEYAQLRDYYTRLMNNDASVPAVDRQAHTQQRNNVLRRLGELESKYPVLGKGWSAGNSPTLSSVGGRTIQGPGGKTYNVRKVK